MVKVEEEEASRDPVIMMIFSNLKYYYYARNLLGWDMGVSRFVYLNVLEKERLVSASNSIY